MTFNFVYNLFYGIQSNRFMEDLNYTLEQEECVLFLREIVFFTPDLQRVLYNFAESLDVSLHTLNFYMNYPLIDKMMFQIGEYFTDKFFEVEALGKCLV